MSKVRVITIICWIISAIVLIGLAGWFAFGIGWGGLSGMSININNSLTGPFEEQGSHSVPADGISAMSINWTAGAVTILPHNGTDIRITEFAQRDLRDGEELSLRTDGGIIRIEYITGRNFNNLPAKYLEVLVPYALIEGFEAVGITTVSARVEISNLSARELHVGTTSGRIELSGGGAHELSLSSVSGRVEMDNVVAQSLDVSTTSGNQTLIGTFGDVVLGSVSGRLELTSETLPDSFRANTTSGAMRLTIPDEGPISVSHSSVSGRFESEIPVVMHGPDVQFRFSTVSGRTSIYTLG